MVGYFYQKFNTVIFILPQSLDMILDATQSSKIIYLLLAELFT